MKIPIQVKGTIQRIISNIFSWDKLHEFGESIGVDTKIIRKKREEGSDFDPNWSKKKAAAYIMDNSGEDEGEIILKTLILMSKKANWDKDMSDEVINDLNPILKKTMKLNINSEGDIEPIFDELKDIPSRIPNKLKKFGFENEAIDYIKAYKGYQENDKGSIATIRAVLESISEEMLKSEGINVTNQMDRFIHLEKLGILKEIDKTQCKSCGIRRNDLELNNAYNIYSLLSHFGSHPGELTSERAEYLFTSSSIFIWFLIKRYEKKIIT